MAIMTYEQSRRIHPTAGIIIQPKTVTMWEALAK